jgi:hypothetical protein
MIMPVKSNHANLSLMMHLREQNFGNHAHVASSMFPCGERTGLSDDIKTSV